MTNQVEQKNMVAEKNITDKALNTITRYLNEGVMHLPQNYSVENAMKSAYLTLEQMTVKVEDKSSGKTVTKYMKALEYCSKESIYQALLDMAIQGLTPAKNQCYFINYGNKLKLSRSYMGTIAVAKSQVKEIKDVKGYCLYEGDEFETEFDYTTGCFKVKKFNPKMDNIDNKKIIGAFALIIGEHGVMHTEIMNMTQIKNAWNMGQMNGNSKAHQNFPDQMAIRTVINRACKLYINTSDDSSMLFSEAYSSADEENRYKNAIENVDVTVEEEIKENANAIEVDFAEVGEEKKKEIEEPTIQKNFDTTQLTMEEVNRIVEETKAPF